MSTPKAAQNEAPDFYIGLNVSHKVWTPFEDSFSTFEGRFQEEDTTETVLGVDMKNSWSTLKYVSPDFISDALDGILFLYIYTGNPLHPLMSDDFEFHYSNNNSTYRDTQKTSDIDFNSTFYTINTDPLYMDGTIFHEDKQKTLLYIRQVHIINDVFGSLSDNLYVSKEITRIYSVSELNIKKPVAFVKYRAWSEEDRTNLYLPIEFSKSKGEKVFVEKNLKRISDILHITFGNQYKFGYGYGQSTIYSQLPIRIYNASMSSGSIPVGTANFSIKDSITNRFFLEFSDAFFLDSIRIEYTSFRGGKGEVDLGSSYYGLGDVGIDVDTDIELIALQSIKYENDSLNLHLIKNFELGYLKLSFVGEMDRFILEQNQSAVSSGDRINFLVPNSSENGTPDSNTYIGLFWEINISFGMHF